MFINKIKTIKNNKQKLLDFLGYDNINQLRSDGGFRNNTEAYNYAKEQYNIEVDNFNIEERNSTIINPITNRRIKKYSLLDLNGNVRAKYKNKIIIENNEIIKNPYLIVINENTKQVAKININDNLPILQNVFQSNIQKNQLKPNSILNGYIIKHNIPADEKVRVSININFTGIFSTETKPLRISATNILVSGRELSDKSFVEDLIRKNDLYSSLTKITIINAEIVASLNKAILTLDNMVLRESKPLNISNIYNEVIHSEKIEHCIHDYMFKIYPKHSKSENQRDKIRKLHTTNDIYEWCKNYNIKMLAFDINRNIIKSNYPEKKNKLTSMIYLAFDNHLYPMKNQYLKKKKIDKYRVKIIENGKTELIKILELGYYPLDIKINNSGEITSFIYDDPDDNLLPIHYTENQDYFKCETILDKWGIKDKMTITTKLSHLGNIIEKTYIQDINAKSFFPYGSEFNKGAFNYINDELELEENEVFQTIDKNKSYSYELAQLPYLIKCDIKIHKSRKINEIMTPHKIIEHYLYSVDVNNPSLIIPNNGWFEGDLLIKARELGIKFRIIEEQETEKVFNYYRQFVNDLYTKLDNETFKEIINIHIGKFEISNMKSKHLIFNSILGNGDIECFTGQVFGLNSNYSIGCDVKTSVNIFNKKPIAIQIKDRSRIRLFEMMRKLKLKNSDIKQIKTDSITFKKINDDYDNYINKELWGWKKENFKAINKPNIIKREIRSFEYKTFSGSEYDNIKKSGTIGLGDAGNGKTYKIINEIIPKLNDNYLVLSPSHATIKEYRKLKLNCDVIQKYTFNNNIPEAHTIIVDEIGMVGISAWNMLFKCKMLGKDVMVFGDNSQLEPVNSKICDNPNFYNLMFDTKLKLEDNYRNNFSKEYYNELKKTSKIACENVQCFSEKRVNEVLKHNTTYDKAEVVIAFTHNTRKKYNKLMCEKLGIDNLNDIGTRVICKTNDLRELNIYNNFCFKVVGNDGEHVILTDGIEQYKVEKKYFFKTAWFDFAYARTLYSVQGQTLNSFHYAIEDIGFLGGRELYTLISRLKQEKKIIKKTATKHSLFNKWMNDKNK